MGKVFVSLSKTWQSLKIFEKISIIFIVFLIAATGIFMIFARQPVKTRSRASAPKLTSLSYGKTLAETFSADSISMSKEKAAAKIGNETIYTKDLIEQFNYIHKEDATKSASQEEVKKTKLSLLTEIQDESLLIQYAQKNSIGIGLQLQDPSVYNNLNKDNKKRKLLVQKIKDKITSNKEKISGGMISIWFHDMEEPKVTGATKEEKIQNAQKIAFGKIKALYNEIKNRKEGVTLEQAFKIASGKIKGDTTLKQLDENYDTNASIFFQEAYTKEPIFSFPRLNKTFWNLKPNEMSNIMLVSSEDKTGYEQLYAIVGKFSQSNIGQKRVGDIINEEKAKTLMQTYE